MYYETVFHYRNHNYFQIVSVVLQNVDVRVLTNSNKSDISLYSRFLSLSTLLFASLVCIFITSMETFNTTLPVLNLIGHDYNLMETVVKINPQ